VLLLWSLYRYATEIYDMLALTFWLALASLIAVTFPLYAGKCGKYGVSLAFALGYTCHVLGLNVLWIGVFAVVVFFVPEEKKVCLFVLNPSFSFLLIFSFFRFYSFLL
jgi:hypothetical protein